MNEKKEQKMCKISNKYTIITRFIDSISNHKHLINTIGLAEVNFVVWASHDGQVE